MNERPDPFACHRAGRYREAEALLVGSLARQPRHPDSWNLMGATLAGLRRYPEAENAYRRALALQPNHLGALNNLAVLLRPTGRAEEARRTYLETLRYEPRHVDAWNNLAALHATRQDYAQALACYRKVLQLQPDYGHALGAAANAMAMLCDWSGRTSLRQKLADGIRAGASVTVPVVVLSHLDEPDLQLAGARVWARRFEPVAMGPLPAWQHDRLRVAYLSADLREHPVGLQIVELIERHDRRHFEWFGVYFGPRVSGDATHCRLRLAFDSFLDIARLSDEEAARRLRALEIDILVDLGGHTLDGRPGLVARRPAAIQVNWLGYPGTSGASWIDYIVADRFLVPPESRSGYSERIVYLPDCFWVSDSQRPPPASPCTRDCRFSVAPVAALPLAGPVACCRPSGCRPWSPATCRTTRRERWNWPPIRNVWPACAGPWSNVCRPARCSTPSVSDVISRRLTAQCGRAGRPGRPRPTSSSALPVRRWPPERAGKPTAACRKSLWRFGRQRVVGNRVQFSCLCADRPLAPTRQLRRS